MLRNLFLVAALLSLFLGNVVAQTYPSAIVTPLPAPLLQLMTADLNRDGRPDLIYLDTLSPGGYHILLGNGDGTFQTGQVLTVGINIANGPITVGDINGDGIPDLILRTFSQVLAYLGRGDGTFLPAVSSTITTYQGINNPNGRTALADFDGDGIPDIMYADGYQSIFFQKGDGQGHFTGTNRLPVYLDVGDLYAVDLNGDGRPDLIGSYSGSGFAVLLNTGGGSFATPVLTLTYASLFTLADMNADGNIDVVYAKGSGTAGLGSTLQVVYGKGDGTFGPPVLLATIPSYDASVSGVADLHGDRKMRVFTSSTDGISIALGATPGAYLRYAGASPTDAVGFFVNYSNVVADFNGDGYADVAIAADNAIAILYGNADGTFNGASSIEVGGYIGVGGLQLADVTGDHIPDAVIATNSLFVGKGDGTFTPLAGNNAFPDQGPLYPADFDGDGNIDFLNESTIFYNQGNGTFATTLLGGLATYTTGFASGYYAIADFNNDGKPDIVAGLLSNYTTTSSLGFAISGAASRTFSYTHYGNLIEVPGPMGAGDFDGDHCADLAVSTTAHILILKGDCQGNFQQIASYLTGYTGLPAFDTPFQTTFVATDLAVVDLDGDGHLDILYTISGASIARILYGNGDGTFTQGADIQLAHSSLFVTVGDLDNDGRPDLVFSGHSLVTVFHGQANRTFSAPQYLAAGYQTGKAALADLRRRGRLDIGVPNLGFEGNLTDEQGYSFALFLNPLPPISSNSLNVTLTVSPEPSVVGQPFTATATFVAPANTATPTGTVTFTLDGSMTTTAVLSAGGVATATFPTATVGSHLLAVSYPGDTNFTSVSATTTHIVNGFTTAATLTCLPASIGVDSTETLNVAITSAGGTPTGTVTFSQGTLTLGQSVLVNGSAVFKYIETGAGTYTLTATYAAAGNFTGSSATCSETVTLLPSNSVLGVSPASATAGSPVTLTATVSPSTLPGPTMPTGTVTFFSGSTILGIANLASGSATLTLGSLPGGIDNLTCTYSGSSTYADSSCNTVPVTITAPPTALSLTTSINPASALTPVAFTAHLNINGQTAGAGNVILLTLGSGQPVSLTTDATGTVTYTTSTLTPGSYKVSASFTATPILSSSSAALTEVVNANQTGTGLSGGPNPGYQGQLITLTATVTASSGPAPTGQVTFFDGSTTLGTATLSPTGQATFSTTALAPGTHSLTASYPTGQIDTGSTSPIVSETILPPTFTLSLSPTTISLSRGQQGTASIQLTSIALFSGPLALTDGPLPAYASASIGPSTVNLTAGGTGTSTLTITTASHAKSIVPIRPGRREWPGILTAALVLLVPLSFARNGLRSLRIVGVVLAACALQALTGCTNAWYQENLVAAGSYQIAITATDVNQNSKIAFLTVNIVP